MTLTRKFIFLTQLHQRAQLETEILEHVNQLVHVVSPQGYIANLQTPVFVNLHSDHFLNPSSSTLNQVLNKQ